MKSGRLSTLMPTAGPTPARSDSALVAGLRDIIVLTVVWVVMVAMVDPRGDFPLNDDWVYAAAVRSILRGHFEILSFSSANLGPMAYWGAGVAYLLGFSFDVLRATTLVLGLAGAIGAYGLLRLFDVHRSIALGAALTLSVNPIYLALSCTFMTDIPFVTILMLSMWAIVRGIDRDDDRLVGVGLAIGIVAMTIRQFAVIVLAGYALAHLSRRGLRWRTVVVAILPLVAGFAVDGAYSYWLLVSGRKPYPAGIPTLFVDTSASVLPLLKYQALLVLGTLGLFLAPAIPLLLPYRSGWSSRAFAARCGVVVVLTPLVIYAFAQRHLTMPVMENILHWYGIGPLTNGDTLMKCTHLPVESDGVAVAWKIASIAACLATAALVTALSFGAVKLMRALRRPFVNPQAISTSKALFVIGVGASYTAILTMLSISHPLYDRYLLPLVPLCALGLSCLVGAPSKGSVFVSRARWATSAALLVATAAFSVVTTHDYLAWNRTRWDALQGLLTQGISPHRIDGGYEFDGWYLYDPLYTYSSKKNWWWVDGDEFLTSSGPMPGYEPYEIRPVDRWWKSAGSDVVILRDHDQGPEASSQRGLTEKPRSTGDGNPCS